jgi:hypothetical protein
MITAREFYLKRNDIDYIENYMIEFAKMHVTQALKMAYFNHKINTIDGHNQPIIELDEDSILKAYPLDNVV